MTTSPASLPRNPTAQGQRRRTAPASGSSAESRFLTRIICEAPAESAFLDWTLQLFRQRWHESRLREAKLIRLRGARWMVSIGASSENGPALDGVRGDGYVIEHSPRGGVRVAAKTAEGLAYGLFGLLEERGCGFYMGGAAAPLENWAPERRWIGRRVFNPQFAMRGLLPFHNFGNGPTCWEAEDYRSYFDQMAAQRMNLVMLHAYDYEPHGAFRFRDGWLPGDVRRNHVRFRGKEALPVNAFPRWARKLFPHRQFGPPDVRGTTTLEACIEKSQRLISDAFVHAGKRGIKTCFGFELRGDPRAPEIRERFLARIDHVIETYRPDFLALWQKENMAQIGWTLPVQGSGWEGEWRRHASLLTGLGEPRRGLEVLRLVEFLNLAHRHLERSGKQTRLVLSGWGGDQWMFLPEMFGALHALVHPSVIFSALENLDVNRSTKVAAGYAQLPPERERWPIPWLEADAGSHPSQWHPSASVSALGPVLAHAAKSGCQGVLGIHWRFSRELECETARFARAGWRNESDAEFWQAYASRCYGLKAGRAIAGDLAKLNDLGPAWTGLAPQVECVPFSWESIPEIKLPQTWRERWRAFRDAVQAVRPAIVRHAIEPRSPIATLDAAWFLGNWMEDGGFDPAGKRRSLDAIRQSLQRQLTSNAAKRWPENGRERLSDLLATIEFVLGFDRAAQLMKPGGAVWALREESPLHRGLKAPAHAAKLARRALRLMAEEPLQRALMAYARQVRTTSQRGNLARMLDEAWAAWEAARTELRSIAKAK